MTCWIIHWAFAEEQMEGQTHMQTCSLADFFTLVHSSIYLDTHVCALKYFWKHPRTLSAFTQQGCLSFCLCCFWHPGCFMSAPPLLLDTTVQSTHYLNRKKNDQILLSPLFLPINTDFILFCHYFGFYATRGPWVDLPSVEHSWHSYYYYFPSKLLRFNSYSNF